MQLADTRALEKVTACPAHQETQLSDKPHLQGHLYTGVKWHSFAHVKDSFQDGTSFYSSHKSVQISAQLIL